MFSSILKSRRLAAGLSQTDLAQRVGVSLQSISNYETGRRTPKPSTARRIAWALDCQPEDLEAPHIEEHRRKRYIAYRLRELRLRAGLRQHDIAPQIGVSRSTITFWENLYAAPYTNDLPYLYDALGVTEAEFWQDYE